MIPREEVTNSRGGGPRVGGQESGVRDEQRPPISQGNSGQYPPGVEGRGPEFITTPVFSPDAPIETGGPGFITQTAAEDSAADPRSDTGKWPLVEDNVVPGLPPRAPFKQHRGVRVMTQEMQESLCMLLSVGLSRRQAAARLDIDPSTISHAAARDEEFSAWLRRAEEMATAEPMLCLIAASRKNWRAALTLMQHRRQHQPASSPQEKEERLQERLADARRELEYKQQVALLEEQAREAKRERLRAKERELEAAERAERAERAARRQRRAEKERAAGAKSVQQNAPR